MSWCQIVSYGIIVDVNKNIKATIYQLQDRRWNADKPSATLDP